ncbi:MAG: site-2 protease family protein [Thermoguttaceae bacterium]|nr:site-2 protease family protein [Thermoguttaceae bacterium]MDW8037491.1 site-2 protease family protein [Thermoguttaceae bacterium]
MFQNPLTAMGMLANWFFEALGGGWPSAVWASAEPTWVDGLLVVLKVVLGLCMVIFVHELGHFLVAKWTGVWCEKFYLGFDFFGLRLLRFRWGETEYGIGAFPLGGYVKMLGQEDHPGRLREELERAKAAKTAQNSQSSQIINSSQTTQTSNISQIVDNDSPSEPPRTSSIAQGNAQSSLQTPSPSPAEPSGGQHLPSSEEIAALEAALYHPRSYLAKSVPQRMAIIAAGVVMNVVFAFLVAIWAFAVGVEDVRCGVGEVVPGQPAWQKNILPGDQILQIEGRKVDRFQQLRTDISLGDPEKGVQLLVYRPGEPEPRNIHVYPQSSGKYPTIGVGVPWTTQLMQELAAVPGTAAAQTNPPLMPGDRIIGVNGKPITHYAELRRALATLADQPIELRLRRPSRGIKTAKTPPPAHSEHLPAGNSSPVGEATGQTAALDEQDEEELVVRVAPQPIRRLGLILEMGPIVAIQENSPAQRAGLLAEEKAQGDGTSRPGDILSTLDGQPVGDPLTLPERLRKRAKLQPGSAVRLGVLRQDRLIEFSVPLRNVDVYYESFTAESPVAVPSLGIAYQVRNKVVGIIPGSPAAEAGIQPGSLLLAARLLPPEEFVDPRLTPAQNRAAYKMLAIPIKAVLGDKPNWPYLIHRLQHALPGTTVELQLQDPAGQVQTVRLQPTPLEGAYYPMRGLLLEPDTFHRKADSVLAALGMAYQETVDSLTLIFRMLGALGSGQVSASELRGPIGIIDAAVQFASAGTGEFLLFLCILSANLAVLNFLPIPVLDGGHMVFLAYEGIRGKPPSERVLVTLTYLGLVFILGLVIWVTGMDIGRWFAGN